MKRTTLLLALALGSQLSALSQNKPCAHPGLNCGKLADAIYRAEGGAKARSPYGVLSVKLRAPTSALRTQEARRITLNSIHNNWKRWQALDPRPSTLDSFIPFMADRWCPVAADPQGNKNWKKNVTAIYNSRH